MKKALTLSKTGKMLYENAKAETMKEFENFQRVRTRVYYPIEESGIGSFELRQMINDVTDEFHLNIEGADRNAKFFKLIHARVMDLLEMKIHRLSPENYLVVTRKPDGEILFFVRDNVASEKQNIRIRFANEKLESGKIEEVPFHTARESIELNY